jgi:hypothetical protein
MRLALDIVIGEDSRKQFCSVCPLCNALMSAWRANVCPTCGVEYDITRRRLLVNDEQLAILAGRTFKESAK